jgi:hypothetical protein
MPELAELLGAAECPATTVMLPGSGEPVDVPTLRRRECRWNGPTDASFRSVPNKPPLEFSGEPSWAEIILVKLLERGGWQAVWVKNWGGRAFWRDVGGPATTLPAAPAALFSTIENCMASRGGCWDVLAWRGLEFLFIESKQRGRDRLRPMQLAWLESALGVGTPLSSFAVVEWFI